MKLPKLTKINKLRIGQAACVIMYAFGAAAYGVPNYLEGREAAEQAKESVLNYLEGREAAEQAKENEQKDS